MIENELKKQINFSAYTIFGKYDFREYVLVIKYNNSFHKIVITKTLWKVHNSLEID